MRALVLGAVMLAGCAGTLQESDTLEVYLVRHGEKAEGADPALTPKGEARALALVEALEGVELDGVWSTDTRRTRMTAMPIAAEQVVDVRIYDGRNLPKLVAKLRKEGGVQLVVGHSNTTPDVVALLGGEPGAPIVEGTTGGNGEYDRLYRVSDGGTTELVRYGLRFGG